jgi:hypothetical protein
MRKKKCRRECGLGDDFVNVSEQIAKDFNWCLRGVNPMHQFFPVKVQHRFGFPVVNFQPIANNFEIRVIQAILLERTPLETFDHRFEVSAMKIENSLHLESAFEHFGLMDVTRNSVEHQCVVFGMEAPTLFAVVNELPPKLDGGFVGHELAAARVFDEDTAQWIAGGEGTKNIATRAVEKMGDRCEDFSLSAFAGAGCAKEQDRAIFHAGLGRR